MKAKKITAILSLAVFFIFGIFGVIYMFTQPVTYNGSDTDVTALYKDPGSYDNSDADGIASIIVNEDLQKTNAVNAVTAVVFDFRGYDTMGESFILITAISGSMAILRKAKKGGAGSLEDEHEEKH
ncbi:MAG: hydrogen gas-evolving membrane-bound hydrogenase subunit E [Oscillospiraceae bacterium]